jgi:hypothetical protein
MAVKVMAPDLKDLDQLRDIISSKDEYAASMGERLNPQVPSRPRFANAMTNDRRYQAFNFATHHSPVNTSRLG